MPARFLTKEQRVSYDGYTHDPSIEELGSKFFLDDLDKRFIKQRRGEKNRIGLAVQLCTARYLGYFLTDLRSAPDEVVRYVGCQLV